MTDYKMAVPLYFKVFHNVKNFLWQDYGFSFTNKKKENTTMTYESCPSNNKYAIPLNNAFINCNTDYYAIIYPYINMKYENLLIFKPEVLKMWIKNNRDKWIRKAIGGVDYMVFNNNFKAHDTADFIINLRD